VLDDQKLDTNVSQTLTPSLGDLGATKPSHKNIAYDIQNNLYARQGYSCAIPWQNTRSLIFLNKHTKNKVAYLLHKF